MIIKRSHKRLPATRTTEQELKALGEWIDFERDWLRHCFVHQVPVDPKRAVLLSQAEGFRIRLELATHIPPPECGTKHVPQDEQPKE